VKIYTRTGDAGATALLGGKRVRKDHARVAAYGEVDELSAALGVAKAQAVGDAALVDLLDGVQRDLFAIGAQLADPKTTVAERRTKAALTPAHVARLEAAIDERQERMPPLKAFLLPGGSPLGAQLHLARAVCRRAERAIVALARRQRLPPLVLPYLNRLSDLLFVLARHENLASGHPEEPW
jgi:cob(I)alamin adenosyltransferase